MTVASDECSVGSHALSPPYPQITLVRGGVEVNADLIRLAIEPSIGMALKSGFDISSKVDIIRLPSALCVRAYIDILFFKKCCAGRGRWKICAPCGGEWKTLTEWDVGCFSVLGGARHTVLVVDSGGAKLTPPPLGVVSVESLKGASHAALESSALAHLPGHPALSCHSPRPLPPHPSFPPAHLATFSARLG